MAQELHAMVLVVLDDVAFEARLILGVVLDEAAVQLGFHYGKRVVIHRVDGRCALAIVNHRDLAKVMSFNQLIDLNFFASKVLNSDLAVALSNVVERLVIHLTLHHHWCVRQLKRGVESLDDRWQESVHSLSHELIQMDRALPLVRIWRDSH